MKRHFIVLWLLIVGSLIVCCPVYSDNNKIDVQVFTDEQARQTIKDIRRIINREYLHANTSQLFIEQLNRKILLDPFSFQGQFSLFNKQLAAFMRKASGDAHIDISENNTAIKLELTKQAEIPNKDSHLNFSQVDVLPGNIGYIRVNHLYYYSMSQLNITNAFNELSSVEALIIDLSDFEGGTYPLAEFLLGFFMPHNTVLAHIVDNNSKQGNPLLARQGMNNVQFNDDTPVYIINSSFVSGVGEFFSYTLKHFDKAVILGETTMGIAELVDTIPVNEFIKITLPIASPINPITETNWKGAGVIPDIFLSTTQSFEKAYDLAINYQN